MVPLLQLLSTIQTYFCHSLRIIPLRNRGNLDRLVFLRKLTLILLLFAEFWDNFGAEIDFLHVLNSLWVYSVLCSQFSRMKSSLMSAWGGLIIRKCAGCNKWCLRSRLMNVRGIMGDSIGGHCCSSLFKSSYDFHSWLRNWFIGPSQRALRLSLIKEVFFLGLMLGHIESHWWHYWKVINGLKYIFLIILFLK